MTGAAPVLEETLFAVGVAAACAWSSLPNQLDILSSRVSVRPELRIQALLTIAHEIFACLAAKIANRSDG